MTSRSRLHRMSKIGAVVLGAGLLSGCAYWPSAGASGLIYTNVTRPIQVLDPTAAYSRTGEACATGVLGLFASGKPTVTAAKENGGIENITIVEERFTQLLFGAYANYCTVVSGN